MPSIIEVDTIKNKTGTQNTVLSTDGSGNVTIANSTFNGAIASTATGTFSGTIGSNATFPAGHVLQVLTQQVSSNSITVSCISGDFATVPTIQQAITPSSTSSKILVLVFIGAFDFSSTNYGLAGMGVFQRKIASGSFTDIGTGTGNTVFNGTFSMAQPTNNQYYNGPGMAQCIDEPNTTSECTYGIGVADHNNGTATFYLNRKNQQDDYPSNGYFSSSLTVMEIAG